NRILSRLGRYSLNLALNPAATINDNLAISIFAAQVVVINLLKTALADDIPRLEAFLFEGGLLQLLRTDLPDVTQDVCEQTIRRVTALWLLFNAQLRTRQHRSVD